MCNGRCAWKDSPIFRDSTALLTDASAWISIPLLVFLATLLLNLVWYGLRCPTLPAVSLRPTRLDRWLGNGLYAGAAVLAPARAIFAVLPATARWAALRLWGQRYRQRWESVPMQALRTLGEVLNLWLTPVGAALILDLEPGSFASSLVLVAVGSEIVRLVAQKGQMSFSGAWQLLDHRAAATRIGRWRTASHWADRLLRPLDRYCHFYRLDDADRLDLLAAWLRQRAHRDAGVSARLRYFGGFRIVPGQHYLRSGHVRDIVTGEVFIHRSWTNDPWLLIGQALRRTPWIFDPRYLARPFHYRSGANRLVTLFVLRHARYSPPYAWYQVGHEIKAASVTPAYWLLRRLGRDIEGWVRADGTYDFDSAPALGGAPQPQQPLWTDDEVVSDQRARSAEGAAPSPLAIGRRYAYPLTYVQEVLYPRLQRECAWEERDRYPKAAATASATADGASQCG